MDQAELVPCGSSDGKEIIFDKVSNFIRGPETSTENLKA
jgi:hypothetical protein